MSALLHDAHCHVQYQLTGASHYVVNGTSPSDWADVLKLAAQDQRVIPAIGLHPWKVNDAPTNWQAQFLQALPRAQAVGEIGLDQWIEGGDIMQQEAAFRWQLKQATERNLPVSIHCLKASEALMRILKRSPLPTRGIHLHAYSGSAEQVNTFANFSAYFSFNAGQFRAGAKKVLAAICAVPGDRLLIETDASDKLQGDHNQAALLRNGYEQVAKLRGITTEALAKQVAANFKRFFLDD